MNIRAVDILIAVINLVITFIFIRALVFKPVYNFISARNAKIAQREQEANKAVEAAAEKQAEVNKRLAEFNDEKTALLIQAHKEAEDESARQLGEAKAKANSIVEDAIAQSQEIARQAIVEQEKTIVELSAALAGKMLSRTVTLEDNAAIADAFFQEVKDNGLRNS